MTVADLASVEAIAAEAHPRHFEHPAVFAERLALAPEGCRVLAGGDVPVGYAISHPWARDRPPPLDTLLGSVKRPARAWFLHDVALRPSMRGKGLAEAAVMALLTRAARRGCRRATLVALAGKEAYWERFGFVAEPPACAASLASYGEGAVFMARRLVAHATAPHAGDRAAGRHAVAG